ncbi:MAG: ABC transporter permease [Mariprofundaceae bacterium]
MKLHEPLLSAWNHRAENIGDVALRSMHGMRRFFKLLFVTAKIGTRLHWLQRPAVVNVLIRQIYFTGVQNLPWILIMALCVGALSVYQIVLFSKGIEDPSLIGTLMNVLLVQELAPLLVAIFLLARSGVAVVSEVAHMHLRGEDFLLHSLGIDRNEYLHLPRFIAFGFCGVVLTFIFVVFSIWMGGLILAWNQELGFSQFLLEVKRGVSLDGLVMMVTKGLIYPFLCCALLIDQGCRVGHDPNQIPVRSTNGVLGSLMLILILDVVIGIVLSAI